MTGGLLPVQQGPVDIRDGVITLQPAKEADFEVLLAYVECYYNLDDIAFDRERCGGALLQLLRDEALGLARFICVGEKRVGYMVLTSGFDHEFGGRTANLTDFYLEEGQRSRGVGAKALDLLLAEARTIGFVAIELQVIHHNVRARHVYERHGFEALDRMPMILRLDAKQV
jgi:GNAT superfamily N-acetyltransferase